MMEGEVLSKIFATGTDGAVLFVAYFVFRINTRLTILETEFRNFKQHYDEAIKR